MEDHLLKLQGEHGRNEKDDEEVAVDENDKLMPDRDHHDVSEKFGLKLPNKSTHSQWSAGAGTAGCDPLEVKAVAWSGTGTAGCDPLFKGASNYTLRLIANGRFWSQLLKQFATDNQMPTRTKDERVAVWQEIGKSMEDHLLKLQGATSNEATTNQIDQLTLDRDRLRAELRELKQMSSTPAPEELSPIAALRSGIECGLECRLYRTRIT